MQKFFVYLTQMGLFSLFLALSAVLGTEMIGETFNYSALLLSLIAVIIILAISVKIISN